MTLSQANACSRLSSLGLKQPVVHGILNEVNRWLRCNGPEWTVSRLKQLKTWYIQGFTGEAETPSWVSYRNSAPLGPFRALWHGTSVKSRARALNSLMVYSTQVAAVPTEKQLNKFLTSVENPTPMRSLVDVFPCEVRLTASSVKATCATLADLSVAPTRRCPTVNGKTEVESEVTKWWPLAVDNGTVRIASQRFKEVFRDLKEDIFPFTRNMPNWDNIPVIGKISFIQEPGYKLRAVANPNRIHQLALKPLQRTLLDRLRVMKGDCTFDQGEGVRWVQEQLKSNKVCYSIDLSDATNNFPLELQMDCLRGLLDPSWNQHLDYFEYCSKGPWYFKVPNQPGRTIRWNKGQPLGLGPSFPAFAITHHWVVRRCGGSESNYRILGDDIVISSDSVAHFYLNALEQMGCPISKDKTIRSERVAEFAGKVIFPDAVVTPFKWREISDRSFIDSVRNLGPQFIPHLRPRQRAVAEKMAEIPEEFGGLGFNPHGKSYQTRLDENWETIKALESEGSGSSYVKTSDQVFKWRLQLGLTKHTAFNPNTWGVPVAEAPPAPIPGKHVKENIIHALSIAQEWLMSSENVPSGYTPEVSISDPRGRTTLESLESRLRSSSEPEPAPKDSEPGF